VGTFAVADVFLSYSHQDRDKARQIAEALTTEKFSVWWDREIPTGRDYQEVIEKEIGAACCVVVLWSTISVKSQFVRSEATEGNDREILLPIMIETVRVPLAFKLIQTEDFTGWEGDRKSECWTRLVLQVRAMARTQSSDQMAEDSKPPQVAAVSRSSGAILASSALATLWTVWTWSPKALSGVFAVTLGIAAVVFLLFRMAESDVSPRMRALATQWLLPRVGGAHVKTAEAFNHLFEAVFGNEHFSAYCFVRATAASVVFLTIVLLLIRFVLGATVVFTPGTWISLFLYAGTVNILGDYSALYVTRVMLRLYRNGMNIVLIVLVDFIATLAVFVATIGAAILVIYGISVLNGDTSALDGAGLGEAVLRDLTRVVRQPYLDLYSPHSPDLLPPGQRRLLYGSAATTFVTSIWLWAALLLSPVFRLLVWVTGTGLTAVGFFFDVYRAPFAALGYLGALIILIVGSTIWGVGEIVAGLRG
jgi:TIR domain